VVINYNMSPTVPGKGSAFFLHETENTPTEGCVSIPQGDLVRILGWLEPARHPRILLGLGLSGLCGAPVYRLRTDV
jgi:L,D-peptidoglycan transpeptidase YkuD (ErfK/YbiS/YcfS/YnhG family)